jgi:hypothetical protein
LSLVVRFAWLLFPVATMYAAGGGRRAQTPQVGSAATQDEPGWVTAALAAEGVVGVGRV